MPILIGGVLAGAALLLWMRSRDSQQVVSNQPALTLYPSTQADRSTVANLLHAVNAIGQPNTNTGGSNPNPVPGQNNTTTPNPTNDQWTQWWNWWLSHNFTPNIPVGGNGGGGTGSTPPPSQTGSGNPLGGTPGTTPETSPSPLVGLFGLNFGLPGRSINDAIAAAGTPGLSYAAQQALLNPSGGYALSQQQYLSQADATNPTDISIYQQLFSPSASFKDVQKAIVSRQTSGQDPSLVGGQTYNPTTGGYTTNAPSGKYADPLYQSALNGPQQHLVYVPGPGGDMTSGSYQYVNQIWDPTQGKYVNA